MKIRIIGKEIIPPNGRMKSCGASRKDWVGFGITRENRKWWWWYYRHAWFTSMSRDI